MAPSNSDSEQPDSRGSDIDKGSIMSMLSTSHGPKGGQGQRQYLCNSWPSVC